MRCLQGREWNEKAEVIVLSPILTKFNSKFLLVNSSRDTRNVLVPGREQALFFFLTIYNKFHALSLMFCATPANLSTFIVDSYDNSSLLIVKT
ncbi:hypothetical protein DP117_20230 [Brasilonema sp. UFV-L1]|nr:hypothetical protein [Brasilonema sp. UFV-L1]